MRFNRTKRALAALLAVLTLLSVFGLSGPLGLIREADAASTYYYNPKQAAQWAATYDNVYNTDGACATFVKRALAAGGLKDATVSANSETNTLINYIKKNNYGTEFAVNDTNLKKIKPGDVVAIYNSKGVAHVMMVTEVGSDYVKISQRNTERLNLKITFTNLKKYHTNWTNGTKTTFMSMYDTSQSSYLSKCTEYPTHGTVETTKYTTLKTLPCSASTDPNSKDVTTLGSAQKVEVIALLKNSAGNYWYRALYSGKECYLYAGDTKFKDWLGNDITLSGATNPSTIIKGNGFHIKGTVGAKYNQLNSISAYIYSGSTTSGTPVTSSSVSGLSTKSYSIYNTSLDNQLKFGSLSVGNYTYALKVTCSYHYSNSGTSMTGVCNATPYLIHSNAFSVKKDSTPVTQGAYLDLNGMLDGSSADNIEGFGTADVYINGTLVENDCTDYYAKWPAGTRYEIKDIRAKSGKVYAGVYSGSISGTIQTSRINVVLSFNTAKTPTVYFNANGGSVNTSGKTVTVGSTYGTLPTPTRTGYAFDGWYTSASGGSKVTPSTTVSNSSNHTLYAHWNLAVYFNANGGSVSPSSVSIGHGRTYGTLPTPSRTGYAFDGWYTSASGGSKVTSGSTVTYGHTLYAHWSAKLNGWQTANNQTYYYRDGIKVTGWQKIDGRRFYFNASGAMLKGWQQIGGKWYYFIVQGSVGQSGTMLAGWQHLSGGKTFYFNSSGVMQTGWQKIGGKWYYFLVQGKAGQSGTMLTGWQKLSNKWYYFNASGAMQTGWQKISNNWYYFNASGVMLTGRQKIDGKWYRFDTSGRLLP